MPNHPQLAPRAWRPGASRIALPLLVASASLCGATAGCGGAAVEAKGRAGIDLAALDDAGKQPIERPVAVAAQKLAIVDAKVMTATGVTHAPGHVIVDGGRIIAVGAGAPPAELLEGAQVLSVQGRVVTPGLIDTHSHMGVYPNPSARAHSDGNEATDPTTAGVWAEHSFWPQDPSIERAVAGGITTIQVLPGSANLIGGRAVTLHLVPHRGARAMRFPGAPDGLKLACGENPKRVYGYGKKSKPSTRMGNVRGQRSAFFQAEAHRAKAEKARELPRSLSLESLAGLLDGRLLAHVHCYRADDMLSFLQMADEAGFSIRSFHHAVEAYKIRDILKEADVSVSTWADWWGFKLEAYDAVPETLAMIAADGGRSVVHSDSARGIQRLNQEAAKALWDGRHMGLELSDDEALRWITYQPAWTLGIEDEVGTLEVGKRADIVVWDGDPLSVYSKPSLVFIDGALRHRRGSTEAPWSDFERGQEGPVPSQPERPPEGACPFTGTLTGRSGRPGGSGGACPLLAQAES